jgi:hypothetical protein
MTEEIRYDVFLSHNSQDKPAVELLARRLTDEAGLCPFLDKWHLVPGEPWQEALEEALDQSRTCAVFIGPRGISPWEHEEMRLALSLPDSLKHECHEGTNGTNLVRNDRTAFVKFALSRYS